MTTPAVALLLRFPDGSEERYPAPWGTLTANLGQRDDGGCTIYFRGYGGDLLEAVLVDMGKSEPRWPDSYEVVDVN